MRFLKMLVLVPIAVIALVFALANRHLTTVVFDPFGSEVDGLSVRAPLFLVLLGAVALGVIIGGIVMWLRQGRHRRALRAARAELADLREEGDRLRARLAAPQALSGAQPLPPPRRDAA